MLIKYAILLAFLVRTVIPVLVVILTSFKTPFDIFQAPVKWVLEPTLANYEKAFAAGDFSLYARNGLVVALLSSVISIFFSAFAAYGLTQFNLRRSGAVSGLFLLGKLVPAITILLP